MNKQELLQLNKHLSDIQLSISKAQICIQKALSVNSENKHYENKKKPLVVTNRKTGETKVFNSLRQTSRYLGLEKSGSSLSRALKRAKDKVVIGDYLVSPYNEEQEIELP